MIHIVAPGFSASAQGGGGTSLFRGVALAASRISSVICYEISPDLVKRRWTGGVNIAIQRVQEAFELCDLIDSKVDVGDTVIKFSGVNWWSDPVIDLWLCEACLRKGCRLFYADADGPSRLPYLIRHRSYLPRVLNHCEGVLLFGGGARAAHEYRALTTSPVQLISMALAGRSFLNMEHLQASHKWDLAIIVGSPSRREHETMSVVRECRQAGWTPSIVSVDAGEAMEGDDACLHKVTIDDALDLPGIYSQSRFTLNMLRTQARIYPHVPACRIFEAAICGSVIVTEPFFGLSSYLLEGHECVTFQTGLDLADLRAFPEGTRSFMATNARTRVIADTEAACEALCNVLQAEEI